MTSALVLGKFLPPHLGHQFLAERARARADEVFVVVLANSAEPIPVELRHRWLQEMLPWATVVSGVADHPIDYADPAVYDLWARTIKDLIGRESVDLLLTSEPAYGEMTAERLGAQHVLVDPDRRAVPVSATAIRADPYANWAYLAPCVRAWYVKRVCLLGAESTGTTTMVERLAEIFDTVWVPEYGREYSIPKDARGDTWFTEDFVHIALRQQAMEDEAARAANKILFCDTDALTTALFHEQYLGRSAPDVEAIAWSRDYDLTFLTAADFPFVQDGWRNSDEARHRMQRRFETELVRRREPVVELRGSIDERTARAIDEIDSRLGLRPASTVSSTQARLQPRSDSVPSR
ncbi:MAG TPA: AAA family ATPase [Candidatus Limnocylindria bacterium]|nr:AAA family ATPase [Candidatus Limnocylindria bacterium]